MFGNNNFGINNSWANKSVVDRSHPINQVKSGQYTPEVSAYLTHARLQPTFNSTTTSSSSDCMKGYNPHNLSHEYHVANGGCVSDAQKAETKVMSQIGNGIQNVAKIAIKDSLGESISKVCNAIPSASPYTAAAKFACETLVKTKVSEAFEKSPNSSMSGIKKCVMEEKDR